MNPSHLSQWTIEPPHGCRFANMVGGEVTIYFPRGAEKAVHDYIIRAVHEAYKRSLVMPALAQGPAPTHPQPVHTPNTTPSAAPAGMVPVTRAVRMPDRSEATITEYVPASQGPHVAAPVPTAPTSRVVRMPDGSEATITDVAPPAPARAVQTRVSVAAAPLPLTAHPLEQLAGHALPPPEPEPETLDVEAFLQQGDTVPPPASLTQCAHLHAIDKDHVVQCSLEPHTTGMHVIKVGSTFYPLHLAPQETWKRVE